jgi:hypothetical protein
LYDYNSTKDVYLHDFSNSEIEDKLELKKHIQIRLREIVDDYLNKNNVSVRNVLNQKDFEEYSKELQAMKKDLFGENEVDDIKVNKLNAKWKINKRKEKYVRDTLMKEIVSEYFILNQLAFYEFGWSLSVKNSYGYKFSKSFLTEYFHPENNSERVHKYIYSALSCTGQLYLHNLGDISPWLGINWININIPPATSNNQQKVIFTATDCHLTENIEKLKIAYAFQDEPVQLIKFCEFVINSIESVQTVKLLSIQHFKYQERYLFEKDGTTIQVNLSYNGKWEFKIQSNQTIDEELKNILENSISINTPYHIIDDGSWQSKSLLLLQQKLQENNCFISEFEHHDWLYDLKIFSNNNDVTRAQLNYNSDGFFTRLNIVGNTNPELTKLIIKYLKEISQS